MSFDLPTDQAPVFVAAAALGGFAGWLTGQSLGWGVVGAVIGLGVAVLIVVFGIRPIVAVPVGFGAGIGAYLGGTIVGVLCEPKGCPAFQATAATATGLGTLVGIGMVVALATRSFDEYREATDRGANPPTTGCSTGDEPDSD